MRKSRDCHWEASCGGAEGVKLLAGPQPCAGPLLSSVEGPPPAGAPRKPADAFWSSMSSCFTPPIHPWGGVCVQIIHPERGCSGHGVGAQGPSERVC